jgi:hypothetical protein
MKIERRVIDEKKGIICITTEDERFYSRLKGDKLIYAPSITWILDVGYPKGIGFYKWLANKGWDEAEALKSAAADKGSKIHQAIDYLLDGNVVKIESKFTNYEKGIEEELTAQEYEAVISFKTWFDKAKPVIIQKEFTVFSDDDSYAGTVDLVCKIDGEEWIIDYKSGQYIWPSYELQVSAYKHAIMGEFRLGILQIGYQRNKDKFKFTEVQDKFDLFLGARAIWANDNADVQPLQKDYPLEIQLTLNKEVENGS